MLFLPSGCSGNLINMSMKEPSYYNHSQLIDPFIKASSLDVFKEDY